MQNFDDEFYQRADEHIHLANKQNTNEKNKGKISASFMYSVARYNAYVSASEYTTAAELTEEKEKIINYFVQEYKKMLEENMHDYISNFTKYMTTEDADA